MLDEKIKQFEIDFPKNFADSLIKPYGLIYYNLENKESYDSNHAFIFEKYNIDEAIDDVIVTYKSMGIVPRIYASFEDNQADLVKANLISRGFEVEGYDKIYMVYRNKKVVYQDNRLEIKRIKFFDEYLMNSLLDEEEKTYLVKVIQNNLLHSDFHFFVGYLGNIPVCMASIQYSNELNIGRIDDVKTVNEYRKCGYARELLKFVSEFHNKNYPDYFLYLYSNVPTAIRIYEEIGFEQIKGNHQKWSAWLNV